MQKDLLRRRIELATARTLVDVADRMERRAQRTYDRRDKTGTADRDTWIELSGAAMALSKYGARLRREGVKLGKKHGVTLESLRKK